MNQMIRFRSTCDNLMLNLSPFPVLSTAKMAHILFRKNSGVARAFPGGRAAHLEDQNEEENEERLRKNKRTYRKMRKD